MIGARAFAILGEKHMQGIDADDAAAGAGSSLGNHRQRCEIADPPIPASFECVEMRGEAEAARAVAELRR